MSAVCPACGPVSRRVHSRYERRLLDTAAGGREVMISLSVRRFFCLGPGCTKVTFDVPRAGSGVSHEIQVTGCLLFPVSGTRESGSGVTLD